MDSTSCVYVFTVTFLVCLLFVKALHDGASTTRVVVVSLICALIILGLTVGLIWILGRVPLFGLDANPSLRRQVASVTAGCFLFPLLLFINVLFSFWEVFRKRFERRYPDHNLSFNGKTFVEYHGESETYEIPDGVKKIGDCAFKGCSLPISIRLPNGVEKIGWHAFESCSSLTSINIPESVKEIADGAFEGCSSLTSINIPESVKEIADGAFEGCSSLTSINIPESVKEIADNAFEGCSSLTSINIPESVKKIGEYAFEGCSSLTIRAPKGSYAERFAKENGIDFEPQEATS